MSLRVRQSWQLDPEYWQTFYYNRNIDPVFGKKKLLDVKAGYYDSGGALNELTLVDDGRHFDGDSADGIYSNGVVGTLAELSRAGQTSDDYIIDLRSDSIALQIHSYTLPFRFAHSAPAIVSPLPNSRIWSHVDVSIAVDPTTDSADIFLLPGISTLGVWSGGALFEHQFAGTGSGIAVQKGVGIPRVSGHRYELGVWTKGRSQITLDGGGPIYGLDLLTVIADSIVDANLSFQLFQNHPNPFRTMTFVGWSQPADESVTLTLYDIVGRRIKRLIPDNRYGAGVHYVIWDGSDDSGTPVSSGVYVISGSSGSVKQTKKLVLVH